MTQTEALRLALKALEYEAQKGNDNAYQFEIEAIKAALANEALERKAENARELGLDYEPVEWKMGASGIGGTGVIVPPQRTPITDEDIRRANHHMVCGAYDYSFKQGVRWAEKVHGIKWEWEA